LFREAVIMLPIAFPVPAAVCKTARTGERVAWEKPSAMPIVEASWRERTYEKSLGKFWRRGCSG
jgi:hypothetical protein